MNEEDKSFLNADLYESKLLHLLYGLEYQNIREMAKLTNKELEEIGRVSASIIKEMKDENKKFRDALRTIKKWGIKSQEPLARSCGELAMNTLEEDALW